MTAALAVVLRPLIAEAVREVMVEYAAAEPSRPALLTAKQLCESLQCSRSTLDRLRLEGLPTLVLGDGLRFCLPDVLRWVAERSSTHAMPHPRDAGG